MRPHPCSLTLAAAALTALLGSIDPRAAAQEKRARGIDDVDREFQSAVAHYEARQYAEAQKELELLAARLPDNFEVSELLGLVYAAQGEDQKANPYLEKAARLHPDSGAARTNLATNLVRLGKDDMAMSELRKAVELEPANFDANHNLGEFYARQGHLESAIPYLRRAQELDPSSYPNGYDLALAYMESGKVELARREIHELLGRQDAAELHNLLGELEEKAGDSLTSEREYETAAHLDSSERNLFDWGSELLIHQAFEPATEVFRRGVERYPRSARLQIGLGIALYSRGRYDEAVKAFSLATDLAPSDPRPYLFLAKAYNVSSAEAREVTARLRRFVETNPKNPQARYHYALSLWKGERKAGQGADLDEIEQLLKTAIGLDPRFADAHLRLGILYSDEHRYPKAIEEYREAIKLDPNLAEARYRLGQALVRTGEKAQAQQEFQVYERLHQQEVAEAEKRRAEIKQFVITMKDQPNPH